jgi:hypothetical protein
MQIGVWIQACSGCLEVAVNRPEAEARLEKALLIVDLLDAAGITSEQVSRFAPEHWQQAAEAARVNLPSQQTQDRVLVMLRNREAARKLLRRKPSAVETDSGLHLVSRTSRG